MIYNAMVNYKPDRLYLLLLNFYVQTKIKEKQKCPAVVCLNIKISCC
ncbi:hypothetical protein MTBBW1_1730022 [Desulfamplus magnetovallimortis]|uniref:Uncharacterized protein n=1 Tax=Desulfamplus magnetovallimortis TaxID=1246637 RepID=A0A1W1H9S2_9BACT|nr:hypothetical protein MTBBW1_1730022 [Desulfamplus magnetovallimortis]